MSSVANARTLAILTAVAGCGSTGTATSSLSGPPPGSSAAETPSGSGANADGTSSSDASLGPLDATTGANNAGPTDAGRAGDAARSGAADSGRAPPGPVKGDPSKPMVSIPGAACGAPMVNFGQTVPTIKIDNRDVAVFYPCAHEGAPVTYFMFLHGTLQDGQKIPFTMNAWPVHTLIDQYNIVEVVPQAIGTQWGNGDNGQDLPFLYDVVDWVYANFGTKFDIRSMWIQGGSWGAFYLSTTFACDPKLQSRLNGVQLIVGNGCPTCANRMSCIVGQQEMQLGNGSALTDAQAEQYSDMFNIAPYASQHHCMAKTGPTDVGNVKWWDWPSCDHGWVYNYMMAPGQHADAWDPAAVLKVTQEMKAAE